MNASCSVENKDEYKVLLSDTDFPEHTRVSKQVENQKSVANGNAKPVLAFEMVSLKCESISTDSSMNL